jgi:hypothetical protein
MTATAMPAGSSGPWAPEDLPIAADELGSWSYVVLEEIVDHVALLRRWPWPVVDPLGRLLWPEGAEHDSDDATVDLDLPEEQGTRSPRSSAGRFKHRAVPRDRRSGSD